MAGKKQSLSTDSQIFKSISNHKRGKIFFPNDFFRFGSSTAVRQALKRLEERDVLVRISHGIYLYPKRHKTFGVLQPTIEEIAIAIAKRDKARIIPTGIQAMNKLGLSSQVPLNAVYLTDGSLRKVQLGKRSIKFRKASPRVLSIKDDTNALIILALKEIGEESVTEEIKKKIQSMITKIDSNLVKHDMKLAPTWIAKIMNEALSK